MSAAREFPAGVLERVQAWPRVRPDAVARGRARLVTGRWPSAHEVACSILALRTFGLGHNPTGADARLGPTLGVPAGP